MRERVEERKRKKERRKKKAFEQQTLHNRTGDTPSVCVQDAAVHGTPLTFKVGQT